MKITSVLPRNTWVLLAVMACTSASSGCTSVISSAYLRETWLDAVEHASESRADAKASDKAAADDESNVDNAEETAALPAGRDVNALPDTAAWSPATLDEAVDEARRRLAKSGGLNDAARGTLIATLKSTPRQDWPVVVEEFTAVLAAAQIANAPEASGAAEATDESPSVAAAEPVAPMPPAESPRTAATEPDQPPAQPAPIQPVFAVQNACFASRVRAWGVVDRFETDQFQPGQEVIVYFELDQLTSRESAEGHTTRIDTVLRLVDASGRRVHEWTFEPLEETCGSHRRDYFARYLVAVPPATPAGSCRLEVVVTDTIAGRTAQTSMPLDVAP
ncbi:MAG: hypothetical protein NTY17_02535 [Planctomycetia bacterium]|nr:hypothetical protein [Planctomycetia bacterium]